jgi:hypothetical protein
MRRIEILRGREGDGTRGNTCRQLLFQEQGLYAWWEVKESREKKDGAKGRLSKALGLRRFHKILPRKEGRK